MQNYPKRTQLASRPEGSSANVTSAIGMKEVTGHSRVRRHSLFARTVIWITALVCLALLLATLAQAWSNSYLMQKVQSAQQVLQQKQAQHASLQHAAAHYKDPAIVASEARQQLGYIRPGEQSVVIVNSTDQQQQAVRQSKNAPLSQGYWQAWWQAIFGNE